MCALPRQTDVEVGAAGGVVLILLSSFYMRKVVEGSMKRPDLPF